MKIKFKKEILLHPSAIFIGIVSGIAIGLWSTRLPPHFEKLGRVYLSLLQMCILPIVITAVTSSLGHLLHRKAAKKYLHRLFVVFLIGMLLSACLGVLFAYVFRPGDGISEPQKIMLGTSVGQLQKSVSAFKNMEESPTEVADFFDNIVPTNIFLAVTQGKSLPVLFFVLLLGAALGLLRSENAKVTLMVIDTLYTALFKIVIWVMYALPLGLCCLFAGYVHQISWSVLEILVKWLPTVLAALLVMCATYTVILWRYYGGDFRNVIKVIRYPWIVALGTGSSLVTLPAMLRSLQSGLKINKYLSELVAPLGVHFNLQAVAMFFPLMSLFMAQLYGQPMTLHLMLLTMSVGFFMSLAVPAVPGFGIIGLIPLILQPLGLPAAVGTIIFFIAVPILDPFVTFTNVYANMVSTILIARPGKNNIHEVE